MILRALAAASVLMVTGSTVDSSATGCDGNCEDLPATEEDCWLITGNPSCHAFAYVWDGERDRWSVGDQHYVDGSYEYGPSNCGYTHYWCAPDDEHLAEAERAIAARDVRQLDAILNERDLKFTVNSNRSAIQLLGSCGTDPERVVAHFAVDRADLWFWLSHEKAAAEATTIY